MVVRHRLARSEIRPITRRRFGIAGLLSVCLVCLLVGVPRAAPSADSSLPARLSDQQFWQLVTELSEPGGYFQSDNLVSNELTSQWVIPSVSRQWKAGQAYLGVGPDQNFTYLAAWQPALAFIVDIRQDNLRLQLMYKALIEMSPTRGDFLARLFSRARPPDLPDDAVPEALFAGFRQSAASDELFVETSAAVRHRLITEHGFELGPDDLAGIDYVLSSFRYAGPALAYAPPSSRRQYPSYQDLMLATDQSGVQRSYLASETYYRRLRTMQQKNLVVPVVGDFAGRTALRRVGAFLKEHRAVVGAIYTSNVEQYLFQYGTWPSYYANVSALPVDEDSVFIRSCFNACMSIPGSRSTQLIDPVMALLKDVEAGRIRSYYDVLMRSR